MSGRIVTAAHVAATLRVAASIIEENGWHQGGYAPVAAPSTPQAKCPVCVIGAIALAAGLPPNAWNNEVTGADAAFAHGVMQRAVVELGVYVGVLGATELPAEEDVPTRVGDLWNDAAERTAGQVKRALRGAADDLEAAA